MSNNFRIVLTGAMGGGKSTILSRLKESGVRCVAEPAREILAEQRSIDAPGVPERDPELFSMLMLSRAIQDHTSTRSTDEPVVFDRGIPDMIAYAGLFEIDTKPFWNAARLYRYASPVFFFEGWEAIYTNDNERKIGFEGARKFGSDVRGIYENLGYTIVDVPLVSIPERGAFVMEKLLKMRSL